MIKKYNMEVDCANCAAKMEDAAAKVSGVKKVAVNFMMQKITVDFEDGADVQTVMENILKVCKKVERNASIDF